MFDLTGKKAILTGGKGNLGPIWKATLEGAGAEVHVLDLPYCDVRSKEQIRNATPTGFFTPDIIVNNAAWDPKPSEGGGSFFGNHCEIVDVNLTGAVNVCQVFTPAMCEKGGVVVNVGSIMGNIGADWRNYPAGFDKAVGYNVSKAALVQLSRSITTQYGRFGVRAVTISFGPYDSGLPGDFKDKFLENVPLGRCISEKSLMSTLLYACCCPELAGTQLLCDAGYTAW